jgi:hypothetical protein
LATFISMPGNSWAASAGSVAELAGARAVRLGTDCGLGLLIVILAVAVRDQLPHRRASGFAVLLALLGVALILAGFGLMCRC